MSRFGDDYDDEEFPGQWQLYEANLLRALKGKRGRKFLADLREALMALPERKLIEGALCTVGADQRRGRLVAAAEAELARDRAYQAANPSPWQVDLRIDLSAAEDLDASVARQGEGVCAGGAYLWHQAVRAGADPDEAFAALPLLLGHHEEGEDSGRNDSETADLLADAAGIARNLAWAIGSRNDDSYRRETPEQRWQAFVGWIDGELAGAEKADA